METGKFFENPEGIFKEIKGIYSEADFDISFYERRIGKDPKSILKNKSMSEALKENIVREWERRVFEKKIDYELQILDRMRTEFLN